MEENEMNEWLVFLKRVLRFPVRLVKNGPLLLYFIVVICGLGALGAWIPAAQLWFGKQKVIWLDVHRNLATYVIAIAIAAFADYVVRNREGENKTFGLFLLGLMCLVVTFASIVLLVDAEQTVSRFSFWGALMAAIIWLMVHDSDPDLTKADVYSAIGGELHE
jgi:hypothetical protein